MQIRPPPNSGVDNMWEAFPSSHLKVSTTILRNVSRQNKTFAKYLEPSIQCSLNGDTLTGVGSVGGYSSNQTVKFVSLFLEEGPVISSEHLIQEWDLPSIF
jgi:hypothetical protein